MSPQVARNPAIAPENSPAGGTSTPSTQGHSAATNQGYINQWSHPTGDRSSRTPASGGRSVNTTGGRAAAPPAAGTRPAPGSTTVGGSRPSPTWVNSGGGPAGDRPGPADVSARRPGAAAART